jgi:antitoxin (DNA-binding transcriptional repressor) of toxin-antitoxin stability system
MASVTIEEAQARLPELVHRLTPDEEVVITENDQPVARLVKSAPQPTTKRRLGTMKGSVLHLASDFDAPLEDFREYME